MKTLRIQLFALVLGLSVFGQSAYATMFHDDLETIGADGTSVTSRVVGGITVAIVPGLTAGTYFDQTPVIFFGPAGGVGTANDPLTPANVSGDRFIGGTFTVLTGPITFSFSSPLNQFELTTLDMLEDGESSTAQVTLSAFDSSNFLLDQQIRVGPQGSSGLDLDWIVVSAAENIAYVELEHMGIGFGPAFGIDDLILGTEDSVGIPEPTTALLLALA